MPIRYTRIMINTKCICICNDCGAYASARRKVEHHKTCKPGEGKQWAKFYRRTEGL